jgi:hypothetical protein
MHPSNPKDPAPEQGSTSGLKLDGRTIAIGVVILLVLVFLGWQLFGNRGQTATTETPRADTVQDNGGVGTPATNAIIDSVIVGSSIDSEGCPTTETTTFDQSDTIYFGPVNSDIPQGTDLFARLNFDGQPLEDSDVITADADYTCAAFAFEATSGAEVLESGSYEAQLFVNGNPGDSVSFEVR